MNESLWHRHAAWDTVGLAARALRSWGRCAGFLWAHLMVQPTFKHRRGHSYRRIVTFINLLYVALDDISV